MKAISIGVQAACMFDCTARVPLMIYAKLRGIDVKDPVDLAIVRPGRLIHEAFDRVATKLSAEGRLGDAKAVEAALNETITSKVPELDAETVETHASFLASAIGDAITTKPLALIAHERSLSVLISPQVKVSGRIDTIMGDSSGWVIVERKSGEPHEWHSQQVRLYADILVAKEPTNRIAGLELWYSQYGKKKVQYTNGEILKKLKDSAAQGEMLDEKGARNLVISRCNDCPRLDCGVKHLARVLQTTM
nr:PD-(D/E)XK nuclease family protein [Candidatus Sigynarchaeota archaeon]